MYDKLESEAVESDHRIKKAKEKNVKKELQTGLFAGAKTRSKEFQGGQEEEWKGGREEEESEEGEEAETRIRNFESTLWRLGRKEDLLPQRWDIHRMLSLLLKGQKLSG